MINREGYYVTSSERECTKCGIIFKKTSQTVALCNTCNSERVKNSRTAEKQLWARAKQRSKLSGLDFNIEVSDILIPNVCKYLDLSLEVHKGSSGGRPNSPALDRIDNSKGYIKGNIQVISHLANQMKASASKAELKLFCQRMLSDLDQD